MSSRDLRCCAKRGSGSPAPAAPTAGSTGSSASQYGSERSAGSAEMRLCRCVVPVRGRPTMTIGAVIGMSRISGWRSSRSWIEQPAPQQPGDDGVVAQHAERRQPGLVAQAGEQHVEPLAERRDRRGPRSRPVSARACSSIGSASSRSSAAIGATASWIACDLGREARVRRSRRCAPAPDACRSPGHPAPRAGARCQAVVERWGAAGSDAGGAARAAHHHGAGERGAGADQREAGDVATGERQRARCVRAVRGLRRWLSDTSVGGVPPFG